MQRMSAEHWVFGQVVGPMVFSVPFIGSQAKTLNQTSWGQQVPMVSLSGSGSNKTAADHDASIIWFPGTKPRTFPKPQKLTHMVSITLMHG
jgi:hypothetical protein